MQNLEWFGRLEGVGQEQETPLQPPFCGRLQRNLALQGGVLDHLQDAVHQYLLKLNTRDTLEQEGVSLGNGRKRERRSQFVGGHSK